ncbi:integrase, catalytic region, zinc finger, CCHC-type containing protein [Tanacetum coccineum]
MGYYFYYPLENKIFVARYAEFFETRLIKQEASGSTVDFDEIQSEEAQPSENTSLHQHEVEPDTVDPQTNTVGSKWLFKKKTDMDGNIHTYKARLVAKGFTQTYGVDYEETFSPVADIKAIRILIAIAAYYDYEILQIGVKTAFLNGRLNEDVYMVQPEGPVNPKHPRRNPGESYWTVVKNILKYLRNTRDMFLVYGGDSITKLSVTRYTNASWETHQDDLLSKTGFVFVMNGGAVDWKSSKQSTIAMSSMEAKYIAVAKAAMEAIWICKFIYGLGVVPSIDRPMDMYCDNTGAITIADEPGVQKDNDLVDPFTKPMPCTKHVEHARSIGLRPAGSFMSPFDSTDHATKILSNNDLKGTRTESGFKRAFATLFGQDVETFTGTMFLNMDQLEKKLNNEEFQEIGSMAAFKIPEFRDTLIQHMKSVKKSIDKRARHKREYDSWVNERKMQITKEKVDTSKALDASLVDTESSKTESKEQDTSSRSGNDVHADDADIRPIYDEELMAVVQTTAEINVFAIGQQHTEQPEFNNEGEVDQNAKQCHDTSPLPAKLTDNQITELSYQSLESKNICLKKTVVQF